MGKRFRNNEMAEGIIWNYGSLIILSISGFLFNCLIAYFYDAAALGVFNSTYAWYCVLSQITTWGIHMSVLKLIPEYRENCEEQNKIVCTALLEVLLISVITVMVIESILPHAITDNRQLLESMQLAMLGLPVFSVNKVILNYLNGLSEMKIYAVFQSMRYLAIVISICIMGIGGSNRVWLSFSFTEAEIIVFISALIYLVYRKLISVKISAGYLKEHIRFGTHILPANMVLELNTKVDIICLGFVLKDDYLIGIYSFAILFVEGFYQLYIIVRRSINPKITECHIENNLYQGIENINVNLKKYLKVLSPAALFMIALGYYMICCILGNREYIVGLKFLIIICTAIVISGRKIIFGNIFAQTGFPGYESMINVATVASNFFLNLLLISFWGLSGAAVATAVSHLLFGLLMHYCARRKLKVNI